MCRQYIIRVHNMHILVSWDIFNDSEWEKINNELKQCLKNYSWVKPLKTLYVIRINRDDDRKLIADSITSICKKYKSDLHVVITSILNDGYYTGWLPKDIWEPLNNRTAGDINA